MMDNPLVPAGENNEARDLIAKYNEAKRVRVPYENEWRQVAEFGLPTQYGGWVTTNAPTQAAGTGTAKQARIRMLDSTMRRAIPIYDAVLVRLLTPHNQTYHTLQAEDERARQSRQVQLGLAKLNAYLFRKRYEPAARFIATQSAGYRSIGAYGNAGKLIVWREPNKQLRKRGGLLYMNVPFRALYWTLDDEEQVRDKFRRIDWTRAQAIDALGDACPKKIRESAEKDTTKTFEFVHVVCPSRDYDEHALDYRRHPLASHYVFVEEPTMVKPPAGYQSDPLTISRLDVEGGCPYGYGPAQQVLSSQGLLMAMKRTWVRHGQLSVQPALLTRDDGVMNIEQTPGAQNPGGVNAQGQKLVHSIDVGNFTPAEKLMMNEQQDVKDALFGRVFEIIRDQPQKTATEIIDIAAREAAQLAPTMGLQQSEDLGPTIDREIQLLAEHGELERLELPAELQELDYAPIYTSPLAKAQRSEGVSGFMRLTEMSINVASATGDNRPVRRLNFDKAQPEIADQLSVPPDWVKTDEEMAASDEAAAQQQQIQTATEVAAPAASVFKTLNDNQLKAAK